MVPGRTWVAHRGMQQVHGRPAQPQAVDPIRGLFEVGHHATGGHCSPQLRPVVQLPPVLQLDGTEDRTESLRAHTPEHTQTQGGKHNTNKQMFTLQKK